MPRSFCLPEVPEFCDVAAEYIPVVVSDAPLETSAAPAASVSPRSRDSQMPTKQTTHTNSSSNTALQKTHK